MLLALQHVFQSAPSLFMTALQFMAHPVFHSGREACEIGISVADSSTATLTLPWLAEFSATELGLVLLASPLRRPL